MRLCLTFKVMSVVLSLRRFELSL